MRADPLIVWTFTTVDIEKKVAYEISNFLNENCRKQLKASVGAALIVENKHSNKNLEAY